jgi:hypothetical protein
MAKTKPKMVTAVFRARTNAQAAYDLLRNHGFPDKDINVLMSDKTRAEYLAARTNAEGKVEPGTMAVEGLGVGGAIGTAVGAGVAAVAAIGTLVLVPGIGWVAGPLAAAFAGGGAGAVAGGVVGALVGLGIPEDNAEAYHEALREGGVVLGVVPRSADEAEKLEQEFKDLQGEDVCYC